jgi:hypothetical protein
MPVGHERHGFHNGPGLLNKGPKMPAGILGLHVFDGDGVEHLIEGG